MSAAERVTGALPGQRVELPADAPAFGEGGDDPYRAHLTDPRPRRLELRRCSGATAVTGTTWRLEDLRAPPDAADHRAIEDVEGPLLDIGCGPGRMLDAAARSGVEALGIDVAHEAARASADRGAPVVVSSVFGPVPGEGTFRTVLLMDGNLGIGGDPDALLARCRALLGPGGVVVVEADADESADERGWYVVVDEDGGSSAPFPWARLGHDPLLAALERTGLELSDSRTSGGRRFVHAIRPR